MKKTLILAYILIFSVYYGAFADDLILPVIKSTAVISNAQFSADGTSFAYTVNNRIFIRNAHTFMLQGTSAKNDFTELSSFYATPNKVAYPLVKAFANGNSVIIKSQASAFADIESVSIESLPVTVRNAVVSYDKKSLAFLGSDGMVYVYNLENNGLLSTFAYNISTKDIFFTRKNKIVVADGSKTVSMFNLNGQKENTFTCGNTITAFDLSYDNETLVLADTTGTLNFYNANTSVQIGYSPAFSSKNIQKVEISRNSSRVLVLGNDKSLAVARIQDILFAPNTLAPKILDFPVAYNQVDPNKKETDVTEFNESTIIEYTDINPAEYITSVQETEDPNQIFELKEKIEKNKEIITIQQPEQQYFAPSVQEEEKDAYFSNKNNVEELTPLVKEFREPEKKPEITYKAQEEIIERQPVTKTVQETQVIQEPVPVQTPVVTTPVPAAETPKQLTKKEIREQKAKEKAEAKAAAKKAKEDAKLAAKAEAEAKKAAEAAAKAEAAQQPVTVIVNNTASATEQNNKVEASDNKPKTNDAANENKNNTNYEEPEPPFFENINRKWKKIRQFDDEDIKTLFKDGHGVLVNTGVYKMFAPHYNVEIVVPMGYRNYDLLRPFYFGGTFEMGLGLPEMDFPYKYYNGEGNLQNPDLLFERIYVPFGICMYPLKNSLEVYFETSIGISLVELWNTQMGKQARTTKVYPGFYSNLKFGAAWDFINLSFCGSYDAVTGFALGVEVGAVVNIGGTRTIGSLLQK